LLEHDPEKWVPVFGKRSCSINKLKRDDDSKKSHHALAELIGFGEVRSRHPQQAVVAGEQSFHQLALPCDDRVEEILDLLHLAKGRVAAIEEIMQLAEAGEKRRLVHQPQGGTDQRMADEAAERAAEVGDEVDLAFAVGSAIDLAVGIAVSRRIESADLAMATPGSGGYGPAAARDPSAVGRDLLDGYVSAAAAARDYGVANAEALRAAAATEDEG